MKKPFKIYSFILIALVCLIGVVLLLNFFLKKELEESLGQQLSEASVEYGEISVNIINSTVKLARPKWKIGKYFFQTDEIFIKELSYYDYFFNKKIVIGEIEISNPEVTFNKTDLVEETSNKNDNLHFEKEIAVKKFNITDGFFKLIENDSVPNKFYFSIKELIFQDILVNSKTLKATLPFESNRGMIESDSIFYQVNAEHTAILKNFVLKDGDLKVKDIRIIPEYSKTEFDRRITVEKDRFELKLNSVEINDLEWEFKNDSLQLTSPVSVIHGADLKVYRNKLLPDDTSIKPLYSQMIRELGVKIKFDSIFIDSSQVEYEEKVIDAGPPGKLGFYDLRAKVANITNIGMGLKDFPQTKIHAETRFMNEAKLSLNLEFDARNLEDDFMVSGNLGTISAESMNSFLKPTINVEVEGEIESLFFNFQGNQHVAKGDMRLKYNNFKVEVLKKDGTGKNKLLSGLANLLIKKEANSKNLEKEGVEAERDRTKSFWNYLWLFIKNGALKSFL